MGCSRRAPSIGTIISLIPASLWHLCLAGCIPQSAQVLGQKSSSGMAVPRVPRSHALAPLSATRTLPAAPALPKRARAARQAAEPRPPFQPGGWLPSRAAAEPCHAGPPAPCSLRRWQQLPAAVVGQEEGAQQRPCHPGLVGRSWGPGFALSLCRGAEHRAEIEGLSQSRGPVLPLLAPCSSCRGAAGTGRQL